MADGRTRGKRPKERPGKVSILARPWRTGARIVVYGFPQKYTVSILARPWRTGALGI